MRLTTTQMTMDRRQPRPSQAVGRAASRGMRRSRLLSRLQYVTWIWSSTQHRGLWALVLDWGVRIFGFCIGFMSRLWRRVSCSGHGGGRMTLGWACGSTCRSPARGGGSSFRIAVSAVQRLCDAGGRLEPSDLHRPSVRRLGGPGVTEGRPGLLCPFGVPLSAGAVQGVQRGLAGGLGQGGKRGQAGGRGDQ
jgi:hypothetical protein